MSAIDRLLEQAEGRPLGDSACTIRSETLVPLHTRTNGFFAYHGALLVRPYGAGRGVLGIEQWNLPDLWIDYYPPLPAAEWFACDLFGNQFGASRDAIVHLNVESGEVSFYAPDLEAWAARIEANPRVETAWPLGAEWARVHGGLALSERLLPRTMFILGGDFTMANLCARNEVLVMKTNGPIAQKLRDLPDGTHVKFEIEP